MSPLDMKDETVADFVKRLRSEAWEVTPEPSQVLMIHKASDMIENLQKRCESLMAGDVVAFGHINCGDCGRAMVWQYDGRKGGSPSWMCPNCVLIRMRNAEAMLAQIDNAEVRGGGTPSSVPNGSALSI